MEELTQLQARFEQNVLDAMAAWSYHETDESRLTGIPATVLAMARDLFDAQPEAWIVAVRGYEFDEFREQLSNRAQTNLRQVVSFLKSALRRDGLRDIRPRETMSAIANHHEGDPCQTTNP